MACLAEQHYQCSPDVEGRVLEEPFEAVAVSAADALERRADEPRVDEVAQGTHSQVSGESLVAERH